MKHQTTSEYYIESVHSLCDTPYKELENICYLSHIRVIKLITSYHPTNKLLALTKPERLIDITISNIQ